MDEPYWNMNLMLDWYEKRGVGYGLSSDFMTPESATEFSFYGIYDRNQYEYWDHTLLPEDPDYKLNNSRLSIPHYRYEVRTNNMTHLTNRLDFRMQIDLISDYQYLRDYFPERFRTEYEPPTYASLEYQADRFTASAYMTLRINDFNSTVERLPELRLDFQRQELFANFYYQGEMSLTPLFMRWRRFDRDMEDLWGSRSRRYMPDKDIWDLWNYNTLRFDSLHMLYYPMKIWNINIIPRTGIRLTAYSRTSEREITEDDLSTMFMADEVEGIPWGYRVTNYDSKGGSKFRVVGELGVEVNTKFYHAWQDVKNAFWGLDGLRHVIVPYVNYTYIPRPTVNADNLYYFDEIDRIQEQHFVRTGIVNRLQTRRNGQIHEWLSMEQYWDFFIHDSNRFNHIGDLGTILKFRPFEGLTLSAELLLDIGVNNDHDHTVTRGNKDVGRQPGDQPPYDIDRLSNRPGMARLCTIYLFGRVRSAVRLFHGNTVLIDDSHGHVLYADDAHPDPQRRIRVPAAYRQRPSRLHHLHVRYRPEPGHKGLRRPYQAVPLLVSLRRMRHGADLDPP